MSSDLFDFTKNAAEKEPNRSPVETSGRAPLAHRMRPKTLDEFYGQEKVLAPGRPLRLWIESDRVPSLILWGPPGCGKTTLGHVISQRTGARFESLSAVLSGVREIKEVVERARMTRDLHQRKTILFVDEIHRFNKSQQDALLPHVEEGLVTLIGATTENPSFEVNPALLSRARVIRLEELSNEAIETILKKAILDSERGLGGFIHLSEDALHWLAESAGGDARRALTALENIISQVPAGTGQNLTLEQTQAALESAMKRQPLPYGKQSEEHYNVISAFIKSIRDSDPHAGLYYLARMLECGEDPIFIARRLVILASEDVGNADPRGLLVAIAVKEAVEFIGMPEGRISLAQAVTYLASAPKSNASYMGVEAAIEEVQHSGALPVPFHLRNAPTRLMKEHGYGRGYKYAHSESQQRVKQTHLPDSILGKRFYEPKEIGLEKTIKEKLDQLNPDFE